MSEVNYRLYRGSRQITRRGILRGAVVGGVGLAASALIGCSSKSSSGGTGGGGNASGSTAATAAAVAAGKQGGRIARASGNDPDTFDLHSSETSGTMTPAAPLYNNLIQFDPMKAGDTPSDVIPDLATGWEITPDGMTYTFKLLQNVKFHDGTPFTAADVKASLERQMTPPPELTIAPRNGQLKVIKSVETPDDLTVKLSMTRPASPLSMLSVLAQGWMAVYSKKDILGKFDYKTKANGTGPFRDMKFVRGNKVTLERNKDYHVKGRPYLDGLDLFNIPQEAARDAAMQSGQIHIGAMNSASAVPIKAALGEKANYFKRPDLVFDMMSYNTTKAPWNDERVRRALARAINRDDGIKIVMKGDGAYGGYLQPGGAWALPDNELKKIPGYEPQGPDSLADAKKLLQAAGVADGLKVPLLIRQNVSENQGLFAADQLAKVGILLTQDVVQSAIAYQRLNKREFDLVVFGLTTALDDPDALWAQYHLKGAPGNYADMTTPEIEALFLKQTVELDARKRKEMVNDLQKLSLPLLSKVVFYWKISQVAALKPVKNWLLHARLGDYNNSRFQDVWLDA